MHYGGYKVYISVQGSSYEKNTSAEDMNISPLNTYFKNLKTKLKSLHLIIVHSKTRRKENHKDTCKVKQLYSLI